MPNITKNGSLIRCRNDPEMGMISVSPLLSFWPLNSISFINLLFIISPSSWTLHRQVGWLWISVQIRLFGICISSLAGSLYSIHFLTKKNEPWRWFVCLSQILTWFWGGEKLYSMATKGQKSQESHSWQAAWRSVSGDSWFTSSSCGDGSILLGTEKSFFHFLCLSHKNPYFSGCWQGREAVRCCA